MSEAEQGADTQEVVDTVDTAVEDKARRLGWRPKEEFKGDPERWTDAETFVRRGDEVLPIVQANNRKLEKALNDARAEIADMKATFTKAQEHFSKAEQRGYKNALADLERQQEAATEIGDVAAVKAATREIADLTREMASSAPVDARQSAPNVDAEFQAAFEEWSADNDWFGKDKAMTGFAKELDDELAADGIKPARRLKMVTEAVKAEFAHKFTNERRNSAAAVEGAGGATARRGEKSFNDLPAEAKAFCDKMVKQGLIKDRAAYIKTYEW